MHKAREARSKAQKLAARRSDDVDSLEEQKRALKARLEANEAKIRRVEQMEGSDEDRAAKRVALEAQLPVYPSHTDTLRQTFGAGQSSGNRKVNQLEGELERQIREYKEARELDNLVLSTRVARLGQDHPDLAAALGDREVPMEDYWRFCAQSTNTPERRQQPVVGVELVELLDSSSDDDVVVILDQ